MDCRALCQADPACSAFSASPEPDRAETCFLATTSTLHTRCPIALDPSVRLEDATGLQIARVDEALVAVDAVAGGAHLQTLRVLPQPDCAFSIGVCDVAPNDECACDGSDGDACQYVTVDAEDRVTRTTDPMRATWWLPQLDAAYEGSLRVNLRMAGTCRFLTATGATLTADPTATDGGCPLPTERARWKISYT